MNEKDTRNHSNNEDEGNEKQDDEEIEHEKIVEILKIGNIAKIKGREDQDFYFVGGLRDEYLVILPNFCTCEQFMIRSINRPKNVCKHILAVQMAKNVKKVLEVDWRSLLFKYHDPSLIL